MVYYVIVYGLCLLMLSILIKKKIVRDENTTHTIPKKYANYLNFFEDVKNVSGVVEPNYFDLPDIRGAGLRVGGGGIHGSQEL